MKIKALVITIVILVITNIVSLFYLTRFKNEKDNMSGSLIELKEAKDKEVDALKERVDRINAIIDEDDKETKEEYDLRNSNDYGLHCCLRDLVNGNIEDAKKNLSSNIIIEGNIVSNPSGYGIFRIPDRMMRLRQRAYWLDRKENKYKSIYEIYDIGYINNLFPDRVNTLQVYYIFEDNAWKINEIFIDE